MDGSWATVVSAAAGAGAAESGGMASVSPTTRSTSRVSAGRSLAGLLFAVLRQGVRRHAQVAAETSESDADLPSQELERESREEESQVPESRALQVKSGGTKEDKELELLLADIAKQIALLQQEMREEAGQRKCEEPPQAQASSSEDLQLRKDNLEAEVQIFHNELQKQKTARQLLEEQLRTLERQLLDSTAEKEEIGSLLEALAAQTFASTKAQEQVQKALKDMEELGPANGAVKVMEQLPTVENQADEDMESIAQDMPKLAELHQSNDAVTARYDLRKHQEFAGFLNDADIRLVRAKYLIDLARSKRRPLPRRQEAELCEFVFDGKAESALVSHEEVQNWAAGTRTATICSVSHAWETREHPDPCRYQLELVADRAAWYEAAFETDVWIFYDYVSLFQYERLQTEEERSFRAAMANMHVMYSHECTMTFIIATLTPKDLWKSTMANEKELIPVWWVDSHRIESKPLNCLKENRIEYRQRGWCIGEVSWSSPRTFNSQTQRIDWLGSDQVEPGQGQGLTGKVPLTPAKFIEAMKSAEFTHRDEDMPIVISLQKKIFEEKVAVCEGLVLKGLPVEELFALAEALPLYKSLRNLKLDDFECNKEAAEVFGKALAMSKVVSLELVKPRPGNEDFMAKAVVDALRTNKSLTDVKALDFDSAAKKAVEQALRKKRSMKDRLPLDAPVRLKAVAEALERNSLTNSITGDPDYDEIGNEEAKAVANFLCVTSTPMKSVDFGKTTIGDDGAEALAEALRCNQTLEELCLHEGPITDVGAEALAEALKANKTLRSLTLDALYKALEEAEKIKRDRGDDFHFNSAGGDLKAAERREDIFAAAYHGDLPAVRHFTRRDPTAVAAKGVAGWTALHYAAWHGHPAVLEFLLEKKAPVDAANSGSDRPLHFAAYQGHVACVKLLLKAGAKTDIETDTGKTALDIAKELGKEEVVRLLAAGA